MEDNSTQCFKPFGTISEASPIRSSWNGREEVDDTPPLVYQLDDIGLLFVCVEDPLVLTVHFSWSLGVLKVLVS